METSINQEQKTNSDWQRCRFFAVLILNIFALLSFLHIVAEPEFFQNSKFLKLGNFTGNFCLLAYSFYLLSAFYSSSRKSVFFREQFFDVVFFIPLFLMQFKGLHPAHIILLRQALNLFNLYLGQYTFGHLADSIARKPSRLIITSFFGVILIGSFLLVLPISTAPGHTPSFLTALFTSTSAVCVTGLIVEDTGTYFSTFGQIIIVLLIQIGGLGLMTLSTGISLIAGKRMGMAHTSMMQEMLDQSDIASLKSALKDIFVWAFIIELTGAIILSIRFKILTSCDFSDAIFNGVFHSISAFCNAGFSTYMDSLMSFASDPVINITIMGLIITGGLGFTVLGSIHAYLLGAKNQRIPNQTYMVVMVSLLLIIVGAVVIFLLETHETCMKDLSFPEQVLAAVFQSVTTRTAGFNTVDFSVLSTGSLFFMCMLMFIGASPGSTGGGIKTTTFATIVLFVKTKLKGLNQVSFRGRRINDDTILKAFLITSISGVLVASFVFLLILTEDLPLIALIFEAISAFATVGLSAGITAKLSVIGKLLIVLLMFIGRTGPLTMALSITNQGRSSDIQFPETRILVG